MPLPGKKGTQAYCSLGNVLSPFQCLHCNAGGAKRPCSTEKIQYYYFSFEMEMAFYFLPVAGSA